MVFMANVSLIGRVKVEQCHDSVFRLNLNLECYTSIIYYWLRNISAFLNCFHLFLDFKFRKLIIIYHIIHDTISLVCTGFCQPTDWFTYMSPISLSTVHPSFYQSISFDSHFSTSVILVLSPITNSHINMFNDIFLFSCFYKTFVHAF